MANCKSELPIPSLEVGRGREGSDLLGQRLLASMLQGFGLQKGEGA